MCKSRKSLVFQLALLKISALVEKAIHFSDKKNAMAKHYELIQQVFAVNSGVNFNIGVEKKETKKVNIYVDLHVLKTLPMF